MRTAVALCVFLAGCGPSEITVIVDDELYLDADKDGYTPDEGDCDDDEAAIHPTAKELCDGLDNNCDDIIDDGTVCAVVDTFEQRKVLDVLFVIDNSLSMGAEQGRIQAAASDLVRWTFGDPPYNDAHIGVITTDMDDDDQAGRLQEVAGATFASPEEMTVEEAEMWLTHAVAVGTTGSTSERAREAIEAALQDHRDGPNRDFLRDEAYLAVIVVSDEDDASVEPTVNDFVAMLDAVKRDSGYGFHAIVAPNSSDCPDATPGDAHLDVVAQTGGTTLWICEQDYGPYLTGLAQNAAQSSLADRYPLSETPNGDYLSVQISYLSGESEFLAASQFHWIQDDNTVLLDEPPPSGSEIQISYDRVP